jgi:hypothetical protein
MGTSLGAISYIGAGERILLYIYFVTEVPDK